MERGWGMICESLFSLTQDVYLFTYKKKRHPSINHCSTYTWTNISSSKIQRNYNGLKITAGTHSWGKLWTKHSENKNLTATWEVSGAKPSSTRTTKQVGRPPKPPSGPTLAPIPTLSLFKGPCLLGEQARVSITCFPSWCSTSPSKALLEFLTWFLIHVCWLRCPRTLVSNIRWWEQSWISLGTTLDLLWGLKHTHY